MKIVLVCLHALFLLGFTVFLQFTYFIRPDEYAVLKMASVLKHNIFKRDLKPVADSIRLINTAEDLSLIADLSSFKGNSHVSSAKRVITDRKKLGQLFHILNGHPGEYRYILCDVQFSGESTDDTLLKNEIEKNRNCIVSSELQDGQLIKPIFDVKNGCTSFEVASDNVLVKVPVFVGDSVKSLPVLMYEDLTANQFIRKKSFPFLNGKPAFASIIPEMYYRPHDIELHQNTDPYLMNLWQVLIDQKAFDHFLKNKYIIIGDFKTDMHNTYYGSVPGPLILFNTFLTLKENSDRISMGWLVFLFIVYLFISYRIVFRVRSPENLKETMNKNILFRKYIVKYVSWLGVFICISLISFFIFNRLISVFYIVTYLTALEFLIEKWPAIKSFKITKVLE
jgi:hypothetical protein